MKAISRATGQWYAIKMIQESRIRRVGAQEHSRNTDKEQKDSAFIREISILETLDHVNICQLKEVFREGDNIGKCALPRIIPQTNVESAIF